jgi:hypothetical protein
MTGEDNSDMNLQGRSGRVALPRTKLVLAIEAALFEAPARRAERAAPEVRKSVADMIIQSQLS